MRRRGTTARVSVFPLAAVTAVALAGCGSTVQLAKQHHKGCPSGSFPSGGTGPCISSSAGAYTNTGNTSTNYNTSTTDTTTTSAASLTGPVGTSYEDTDYQNNKMSVTLTQIIDPARGADEFTTPDNGNRFVGAKFKISGISGSFSDDANNDAVLVGSNGQSYQPDFNDIAGCTNFNAGEFNVSPGTSSVGCVVFQVPLGVKVQSIQWGGGLGGGTPATWTP